ncbi:beclin 1-associated autophagy-related key regulator-like [Haemaphysalis longicornis]
MEPHELDPVGVGYRGAPPQEFLVCPPECGVSSTSEVASATERCRVCRQLRASFFCDECIRNGDFTHTQARYPERFAEKKLRLMQLQRHKASLESRILETSQPVLRREGLKEAIQRTREKVAYLRIILEDIRKSGDEGQSRLEQVRAECAEAERLASRVRDKLATRTQQLSGVRASLGAKRQRLEECQRQRQALVHSYVADLARDIFTLEPGGGPEEQQQQHTTTANREVRELEEAQQTVYVRGRWVTLAPTEGCISLVNVRLPTSGDYSQYCHWLAEQQERAWSSTPEEMRNVGYALSAGLLYAAQMVAVLAFYLDLPLPHSLCYSQFGARDESEEEFRNWVARLNSNVLHLCASQGLQPPLLRPRTTLRNLALLVQHRGNIRFGPVDMSHDLWASLEESLGPELLPSDADSDDNDDWEDVTDTSEAASPVQWRPSSPPPPPSSSLLSSAAALVTNFWRPK